MSGPPDNIPPNELWLHLTQIPRPFRLVDFPRKDPITGDPAAKIRMQVLSQAECMASSAEAEAHTRKMLKDQPKSTDMSRGYEDIFNNETSTQLLFRACRRDEEDGKWPFFPSPAHIRNNLTSDEVSVLVREYIILQVEVGPVIAGMTEDEVDLWVTRLVEAGDALPLASFSWAGLTTLAKHMASRLYPYLTDTSSPTSPLESSSPSDLAEPVEHDKSFDRSPEV